MLKKTINLTYLLTLILLVMQIFVSSSRATDGDHLSQIQQKISDIETENTQLKNRIYKTTSLENISLYAQNTGMLPAEITNISSVIVALNRQ